MAGYSFPKAVLLLVALPLLAPAVLGAGVVIGPDSIVDRGSISLSFTNVTNGTGLSTTLAMSFPPAQGVTWFNLTNWNYPFALSQGKVTVSAENVNMLMLLVRSGSTFQTRRVTGTGNISVEIPLEFQPLTFYDFLIGYEVHSEKAPLVFTVVHRGYKDGAATDVHLIPSLIGVGDGNLTVSVLANATSLGSRVIRVYSTAPPPTPAPVNTTAAPSPVTATPAQTTPAAATPSPAGTTPAPTVTTPSSHGTTPVRTTPVTAPPTAAASPAAPAEEPGPSLLIIAYVAIVILITAIADYVLLKD